MGTQTAAMGRANPFRYFLETGERCEVVAEKVMLG
jgi:hypothetical protein